MIHCTRATARILCSLAILATTADLAKAQNAAASNFTIYIQSAPVGTEQITVTQSADGWTVVGSGRLSAPVDMVTKEFTARYDRSWRSVELTVETTLRGQPSILHSVVAGSSMTSTLTGAPGTPPQERTDPINPEGKSGS